MSARSCDVCRMTLAKGLRCTKIRDCWYRFNIRVRHELDDLRLFWGREAVVVGSDEAA